MSAGRGEVLAVLTTAPDEAVAERIGRALVDERLAACANVLPGVTSFFRWEGAVRRESEVLVILKTTPEALEALRIRLVELHPYEIPEVLALDVRAGHAPYLEWVREEVGA
ncbi:MAG TPA: divalent-cation tolerance protein CutA [Longimicrobiales bacterium]|nr:divalent-cation tolerance protein CutA [Longimicrobiales bacterium]